MPTLHDKCKECNALLGPRNPEIKEAWIHHSFCSKYEAPNVEDQVRAAERLTCREKAMLTAGPVQPPPIDDDPRTGIAAALMHGPPSQTAQGSGSLSNPLEDWTKAQVSAIVKGASQGADHILDDTWKAPSGASSSTKAAPFHLIPIGGLRRNANRFGLGLIKHGRGNWEKACFAQDITWMQDRINHGVEHMLQWLREIEGLEPHSGDDHAGAVAWLGDVMSFYEEIWKAERKRREAADGRG